MKTPPRYFFSSRRFVASALGVCLALLVSSAKANLYLDNNGTTSGFGITSGANINWDTAVWTTDSTGVAAPTTYPTGSGNFPRFTPAASAAYTLTLGGDEHMAGLFQTVSTATLTINSTGSGFLDVDAGDQGFLLSGTVIINAPIGGSGAVAPENNSSGVLKLNGVNTYSGGTAFGYLGAPLVYFNNNSAFGSGSIRVINGAGTGLYWALLGQGGATLTIPNAFDLTQNSGSGFNFAPDANTPVVSSGNWSLGPNLVLIRSTGVSGSFLTLNGVISGVGGSVNYTANSVGSVLVNGANTYSGGTTLSSGSSGVQVTMGNPLALGYGPVTVSSGSTLDLNGQAIGNAFVLNGTGTNNNGALINNSSTPVTLNGGAVGSITVTAGGSYSTAPTVTLSGGGGSGATATALLGVTAASFTISSGTQKYSVAPNVTINGTVGGAMATATLTSGSVTGITITSPGAGFTTAPTISFSGGTISTSGTVPSGTGNAANFVVSKVVITSPGTGYTSAPTVTFGSGAATATAAVVGVSLASNGSVGGSGNITNNEVISGTGALTKLGSGIVTLTAANTYSGGTTVSAGTLSVNTIADSGASAIGNSGTLTLSGGKLSYSGAANVTSTRAVTVSGTASILDLPAGNLEFNSAVKSGTITKTGNGTLTLSGTTDNASLGINVNGGTVVFNKTSTSGVHAIGATSSIGNGGTLQLSGSGAFEIYSGVALTVNSGGLFDVNGQSDSFKQLNLAGTGIAGSGALVNNSASTSTLTLSSGIALTANASVGGSGNITLASAVSGTGFSLTQTGTGTLKLNAANTYTGGTIINSGTVEVAGSIQGDAIVSGGTLRLDNASALAAAANLVINTGSSVNLNYLGGMSIATLSLDGGVTFVAAGTWGAPGSGAVNTDARLSGTGILNVGIAGPTGVTLTSSGTPSTYGDAVTFTSVVSGSGATPTGTITFREGATVLATVPLDGTGTATLMTSALNVATHALTATYSGDVNYGAGIPSAVSQVVNKAALTITANNQTKTYGDTVTFGAGSTQFSSSGLQNGETIGSVTLACSGGAATATVSGSPYTISASAATGGTFSAANYTLTYNTGTLTVNPAPLTVTASGWLTYGNDPSNAVYAAAYSGFVNGETASLVTGSADFSTDATATNYIGTNYTAHVQDAGTLAAPNYSFTAGADGVTTITNRPVWVTNALASDKVYDGTAVAVLDMSAAGLTNLVNGDGASVSLVTNSAVGTFADKKAAANKAVVISGLSLAGDLGTNYVLVAPAATASITPASLIVSATAANKVYDQTTAATASLADNKIAGDDVSATYTAAAFADKNAATGKTVTVSGISISGADIGNYTLASTITTATADITPATLTITATGVSKVYDGTTAATVTLADNKLTGDAVTDSYTAATFAGKNVATGIAVSVSGLGISGADAGNYALASTSAGTSADITARTLTVTATGVSKVYDGTTAATVTLADDKVAGDDVTDSYTLAAFADANVGTGKAVSVSGISISGGAVGNYTLANTTANTTADITGAASSTALVSSLNPATEGSNVTFTATVSSAAGTPAGDVIFLANGVPFSTNTLVAGVASASTTTLAVGTNTIAAQYAIQANWLLSSGSLQQVVNSAVILSQTNALLSISANGDGTYRLNLQGTPGASYYVVSSADITAPAGAWSALTYSTNTAPSPSGQWSVVVSNAAPSFYRSAAVNPAP